MDRMLTFLDASVDLSIRWSVHNAFVKIAENGVMQVGDTSYAAYMALFLLFVLVYKVFSQFSIHAFIFSRG